VKGNIYLCFEFGRLSHFHLMRLKHNTGIMTATHPVGQFMPTIGLFADRAARGLSGSFRKESADACMPVIFESVRFNHN
jgi:hypothetical protein